MFSLFLLRISLFSWQQCPRSFLAKRIRLEEYLSLLPIVNLSVHSISLILLTYLDEKGQVQKTPTQL